MILIKDTKSVNAMARKIRVVDFDSFNPSYRALAPIDENFFMTRINNILVKVFHDKITFDDKYYISKSSSPGIKRFFNNLMSYHITDKSARDIKAFLKKFLK